MSTEAGGEESLTLAKLLIARPCAALEQGHGQGGLSRLCLDNDNSRQQTLESDELLGLTSDDTQQNYVPANKKWLTPDFASVHKKWLTPDFASVHKKWLTPDFASVHKKWLSPDFVQIKRKRRDAGSVKKFWIIVAIGLEIY